MKNLKLSFLLLSFLTLTTTAFSQIGIGVRAGINNSSWAFDVSDDEDLDLFESRSSIAFAIPIEISLTDKLAIQPELLYNQHGTELSISFFGISVSTEYVFSYLEIPVLLKYKLGSEKIGVGIMAGPSLSYALTGELKSNALGQSETIDLFEETDVDLLFNRSSINIHAGLSPYFNISDKLSVFLDGRYILGLSDISDEESDPAVSPEDYGTIKNKAIQLSLGALYSF